MRLPLFINAIRHGLFVGLTALFCLPHAQAESEADTYRVAFYNLQNYLEMDRTIEGERLENHPKPEDEIVSLVNTIQNLDADILGLCEIGTEADLADLQERLKQAGLDYPHTEYGGGDDTTRRLAILSRFPIVERNSRSDLPYQLNGRIMRMQRGILDATIDLPNDAFIRCLVVHFKSKRPVPEGEALMRRNEAQITRRHVSAIFRQDPEVLLLLMGDLNDTKNEPAVQEVQGELNSATSLQDLPLADALGDRWTHHWKYADLYSRIDFLMVSRPLHDHFLLDQSGVWRPEDGLIGSDHRPVYATFKLNP